MFCGAGQGRRQKSQPWPNSCPQASRPLRPRLRSSESGRLPRRSWPRPPSVAVSAPGTPASLVPTNVAALIAIGPGVISAMATRSANSCRLSQLCCVTITYPPPNVNALRYSVERNSFSAPVFCSSSDSSPILRGHAPRCFDHRTTGSGTVNAGFGLRLRCAKNVPCHAYGRGRRGMPGYSRIFASSSIVSSNTRSALRTVSGFVRSTPAILSSSSG